jgi:hypothetical protein
LNSLELAAPFRISPDTSHWDEVRRIYRRIGVLRATGREQEAETVENRDLARALTVARAAAESESEETAVLAVEAERVLNASLLAEMLAPLLAERLQSTLGASVADGSRAATFAPPSETTAPVASIAPAKLPQPRKNEGMPSIADLIDGMLSQDASLPTAPGLR